MNLEQDGGFVVDTLLAVIKEGIRIRGKYLKFKAIGMSVQEIVRDSFKPNGLYDIVTSISALNNADPQTQIKMNQVIEQNNLSFFKDFSLKFVHTAGELKTEIEKLRDIVNEVAENIGGQAVANELAITIKDSSELSLQETEEMAENLKHDVKKKGFLSKVRSRIKKKPKNRDKRYDAAYDHIMITYDESSKIHKAAKAAKMGLKIDDLTTNLDDALKQFNLSSQQFQIEFVYHTYQNDKLKNNKLDLIDFTLDLTNAINACDKNDIKGISSCVNKYFTSQKSNLNNQNRSLNEEVTIFIKQFPEIINKNFKRDTRMVDYNLINRTIDNVFSSSSGGGMIDYSQKYKKYKMKYLNLISDFQ